MVGLSITIVAVFFTACAVFTFRMFYRLIGTVSMAPYIAFGVAFAYVLFRRIWMISIWPEKAWVSGMHNNVLAPILIGSFFLVGFCWIDHLARRALRESRELLNNGNEDEVPEGDADKEALVEKLLEISRTLGGLGHGRGGG